MGFGLFGQGPSDVDLKKRGALDVLLGFPGEMWPSETFYAFQRIGVKQEETPAKEQIGVICDRVARHKKDGAFVLEEARGFCLKEAVPYAVSSALWQFKSGNPKALKDVVGIAVFCGYKGTPDGEKDVVRVLFAMGVASDSDKFNPLNSFNHCVREICARSVVVSLLNSFNEDSSVTHPFGPFNEETKTRIEKSLASKAPYFVRYEIPDSSPDDITNYHFEPVRVPPDATPKAKPEATSKFGDIVVNLNGEVLYYKGKTYTPALSL